MFAVLIVLLGSLPLYAESPAAPFLAQADAAYAKRSDLPEAKIALFYYQKAMVADPANVEACWKASRAAWWLGDSAESRAEKLSYFQKGIDYNKAALERDPNSVEAHLWLGNNLGSYGEAKGILKSLFLVKPIRHEMAEVNRIDDRCDGGGGYRVLGVIDYQVPGFAGGSKKRALEELNRTLAMDPQEPYTHYYLADYFKTIGDKDKMRAEWAALKTLKVSPENQPDWERLLKKGETLFGS